MNKYRIDFVPNDTQSYARIQEIGDRVVYTWPLHGGWHDHFTRYVLARILGESLATRICEGKVRNVTVLIDPRELRFPAPKVYNAQRPSLWARVQQLFTTKKER